MTEEIWNDKSRDELRERLRTAIFGEHRLARYDHQEILEYCRDVYLQDVCPEEEWEALLQFAVEEIDRVATEFAGEMAIWPEETDCDRLDRVELALRERGILLWQLSPCCDNCTGAELPDRIDVIDQRCPGFRDRVRGYAFFVDQNMPEMVADSRELSIYLAYGWFSPDEREVAPEIYQTNALGIAREICECLHSEGFEVNWDSDLARKIGVSLNWQRRTVLK
jgi:hypothetical protein